MATTGYMDFVPTDPSLYRTTLEVIHQPIASTGSRGQPVLSDYVVDGTIKALCRQLSDTSAQMVEKTRQLVPTATHIIVTRYNAVLTDRKKLRLTKNGVVRLLNIAHVNNCDELNIEMRCTCIEEVPPDQG